MRTVAHINVDDEMLCDWANDMDEEVDAAEGNVLSMPDCDMQPPDDVGKEGQI